MNNIGENINFDDSLKSINGSKEKVFMGLVLSNQKHIFSYIVTMVPNRSDAEDILQDTMAIMWQKFEEFERGSNFIAWGITIAKYRIMKFRKSKLASKMQLDEDVLELLEKQSEGMLDTLDDRLDALKNCIKKLSSLESRFLRMRYEQDMSFQKIASTVGLTSSGVFKAISRVHYKLIKCIRKSFFNMEAGS